MDKEIGYIKIGSYGGYKVYDRKYCIAIWQIGKAEIIMPKEIAKVIIKEIAKLL
ncbi:MAG: hypothetical protein WCJ60_01545 [bacterium]